MNKQSNSNRHDGFATVDFLIVAVIILIVVSYAFTTLIHAQRAHTREGAAQQFSSYLERARSDSMRRRATDVKQMGEVTILNQQFYSVRIDEDGDGALDIPRVVNLQEQQLTVDGPYPRSFRFDRAGKSVDNTGNPVQPTPIVFANRDGKSAVTIAENGSSSWENNIKK
jgi:Tfp pilus assembly protein FimT